ncbi:MAG TPA: acyl carrier protein [Dehalococcoidia bacterium]|nr:acyl carrier protein [Dehalococcoidia bacterium]
MEKGEIREVIYASMRTINEQKDRGDRLELKEDTCLFGRESKLDSLGLVNLIVDIEQRLTDGFGVEISLTDERAMSPENSPFMNVKSLTDYISSLV